jgi:hypothetical protein
MGRPTPRPLVLDSGALISYERRDRPVAALLLRAYEAGLPIIVPTGVVAQTWHDGARQARLLALLGSRSVTVESLTGIRAKAVGVLCGRTGTSDVVDASVVLSARQHGALVATSDPDDLLKLDSRLFLARV